MVDVNPLVQCAGLIEITLSTVEYSLLEVTIFQAWLLIVQVIFGMTFVSSVPKESSVWSVRLSLYPAGQDFRPTPRYRHSYAIHFLPLLTISRCCIVVETSVLQGSSWEPKFVVSLHVAPRTWPALDLLGGPVPAAYTGPLFAELTRPRHIFSSGPGRIHTIKKRLQKRHQKRASIAFCL